MGLLASVFNSNHNIKKERQKNRNCRICRIEEMESRELLSASPYNPPDPIDFGIVYFDPYGPDLTDSDRVGHDWQVGESVFTISWNGGAEGTQLTELTITLHEDLRFNIDGTGQQPENGPPIEFNVSDNSNVKVLNFDLKDDRTVHITIDGDFTEGMVLEFSVGVNSILKYNEHAEPIVPGATLHGSEVSDSN